MRLARIATIASSLLALAAFTSAAFGQADPLVGKWMGDIQFEGAPDPIAVTLDSFAADGPRGPTRKIILRASLGDWFASEYQTYVYENPVVDVEEGRIFLESPGADLIIEAAFEDSGRRKLKGSVELRSSPANGVITLRRSTQENAVRPQSLRNVSGPLAGQYEGDCEGVRAILQLESARKAKNDPDAGLGTTLLNYNIAGVVGVESGLCSPINGAGRPAYCVDHAFSAGSYDLLSGRLYLAGRLESDECRRVGTDFLCRMSLLPEGAQSGPLVERDCRFSRVEPAAEAAPGSIVSPRRHHSPEAALKEPLPRPTRSARDARAEAVAGTFDGYLHHEYTDRYQVMQIKVNAGSTGDGNATAALTSTLFFGTTIADGYTSQRYARRVVPVAPATGEFTAEDGSTFLHVTRWEESFIAGVWYSRQFGRLGTFELRKSRGRERLPATERPTAWIAGQFRGPSERDASGGDFWDIRIHVPPQRSSALLQFEGNYRLNAGGVAWPTQRIIEGGYDFMTNALSFSIDEEGDSSEARWITGRLVGEDLKVFWPSQRAFAVGIFDRIDGTLKRITP